MNRFLSNKYAFLGKEQKSNTALTNKMRGALKNSTWQFLIFGALICVIGYLAVNKVIPYSLQSGIATTIAYAIAAIGFCLLMGYSGLASLGTGGFIGIGTYSVYYIMNESNMSFAVAIIVALLVSVVIGIIVGFISLRIEGIYLCILTLGLSEILRNLYMALEDTIKISNFEIFGMLVKRQSSIYIVAVVLVVIMIITQNLINSPTGRAMLAMKNSTAAAQAMGISLIKYRMLAFVICTAYAAISGVMLMVCMRAATASDGTGFYALITSLNILAAVIIGGYKSIWGAVFGTYIMYGLQTTLLNRIEVLQKNPVIITFVSGVLVILVVMFYPGGIAQLIWELKGKLKKLFTKLKEVRYGKDLG